MHRGSCNIFFSFPILMLFFLLFFCTIKVAVPLFLNEPQMEILTEKTISLLIKIKNKYIIKITILENYPYYF